MSQPQQTSENSLPNRHQHVSFTRSSDDTLHPSDIEADITSVDRIRTDSDMTMVNRSTSDNTLFMSSDTNDSLIAEQARKQEQKELPEIPPPPYRIATSAGTYNSPRPYRYEKLMQKNPGLMDHPSMTFGGPMIVLFDIVVPCIIYYAWYNARMSEWSYDCAEYQLQEFFCPLPKPEFDKDILGYAVISFGFGELYILLARVYRLYKYRDQCAPLLSRARWELDATSWVYLVSMVCALIPFVVGSTMVKPHLYLYGPAFLMAFLGVLMLLSLTGFPIPIGINSHSRGGGIRPFIYYAAEDFIAVDGLQDRDFRIRYNARYENSPAFRRLFVLLTIWWIIGVVVYITCLSAVIWTMEFHYAFGLSLGILFAYIATWAGTSYIFVSIEEKIEYQRAKEMGILAEEYMD